MQSKLARSVAAQVNTHFFPLPRATQQQTVTEILQWRAAHTPEDRLFSVYNAKGTVISSLTCAQLHQKAERLGSLLRERGSGGVKVAAGSVVALMFMPGPSFVRCLFDLKFPLSSSPVIASRHGDGVRLLRLSLHRRHPGAGSAAPTTAHSHWWQRRQSREW